MFFDFWALGDKQYELYYSEPHLGNRLTRTDFHPAKKTRPGESTEGTWKKVGEWKFDWTGPFYVAAIWDDRYFVSDTGRVFVAPRGGEPGTPLKQIWKGPPVDALIHDSDAKTWFAFTKSL
jgi:hypothetical protein